MSVMRWYFSLVSQWDDATVMDEDWDSLLILDACRYDMFERIVDLPGHTEKRRSSASATDDFLRANFRQGPYHDTVYVTANPRLSTTGDVRAQFHDVIDVWHSHWSEELKTVPPDVMADQTIKAHRQHPTKRIIAHFMQPHGPFIGEFGQKTVGIHSGVMNHRRMAIGEEVDKDELYVWELVRRGLVTPDTAKRAYDENLEIVIPALESVLSTIEGKVVITSDHGNMLGERAWPFPVSVWGHPNGILTKQLIEVPWHVTEIGERRDIVSEEPAATAHPRVGPEIDDRLAQLGYK